MKCVDEEGFIEIECEHVSYTNRDYVEIFFSFSREEVGNGGVSYVFFSLNAIKAFADNLDLMLKGEADEFHISDYNLDCLDIPFYWFDVKRVEDGFEAHLKINDCLEKYIEITEVIDKSKLTEIQNECQEAYEKYKY